ncbi:MAG: tRNA (cytidine(34)-2'-O)-methyltransferase [Oscillospiraceae bacterium]|nr:tRNA (cytidine(34)-2'-O)-methyltransferase [Oscillospiraceae bacterium]
MHIALHEPEIPQNTGNIVRTCSASGAVLHLIEPLGFTVTDSRLKRAGLDYWHGMDIRIHKNVDAFLQSIPGRPWLFTTKGSRPYHEAAFADGDCLLFGKETAGLPEHLRAAYPDRCLRLPMLPETRSLNLSNSVAAALYEALRQQGFPGMG